MEAAGYGLPQTAGFSFEKGVKSFARGARQAAEDIAYGTEEVLSFAHKYIVMPTADVILPIGEALDPDIDVKEYPVPDMSAKNRELARRMFKYLITPTTAAAAFLVVLFPPNNFSTQTNTTENGGNILFATESSAETPDETSTYVRWDSPERIANGERLNRAYWNRRDREHPAPAVMVPEERKFGPLTVSTGFFSETE